MPRIPVAIVGSGNIGTDLLRKLMRSNGLEPVVMVGIDPQSDGLARARKYGIEATADGAEWLTRNAERLGIRIVFEATSAHVHAAHAPLYEQVGLIAVDLTPAALGPAVVPTVNLMAHLDRSNLNMITCGGQATIPIVAAVRRATKVAYAEIVSTVASKSAGPGTRSNIDEFTETTARGLETIGGARIGKAIIVLNPADPPILMRNTVYCALDDDADHEQVELSIRAMEADIQAFVPGYVIKGIVFESGPFVSPAFTAAARVAVLLEVAGNGDYLPRYAGNLDIMTAAAVKVGETLATERLAS